MKNLAKTKMLRGGCVDLDGPSYMESVEAGNVSQTRK